MSSGAYAGERRADRGFFEHELVITTELHTFRLPIRGFVGTEAQYEAAMQKERARIQNRLKHTGERWQHLPRELAHNS